MSDWVVIALVVDPDRGEILVAGNGSGTIRLPSAVMTSDEDFPVDAMNAAVERLLDQPVVPLRIWPRYRKTDEANSVVVLMEPVSAAGDLRYASANDVRRAVDADTLEPGEAIDAIRRWFAAAEVPAATPADPRVPAWVQPGWFARASAWTVDRLEAAGIGVIEAPRYKYLSPLGAILRTASRDRAYFMKCSAPYFRAEPTIVAALARRVPDAVPEVVAIEPDEGWLLMGDVGDRILGRDPEATWPDAMPRLAAIQREWIGHADELVAGGAQVRPLGALAEAVPGFLDRENLGERLDPDVRSRWTEALPRLVDACRRLEDIGLPDALVHGDLHPWNIAVTDGGPRIFDWSDGAVAQPFLDLAVFIRRAKEPEVRARLREAYIDGWADLMPRGRLGEATDLAMAVGALYQVATYLDLLPGMDPLDAVVFASSDANWLRRALETGT